VGKGWFKGCIWGLVGSDGRKVCRITGKAIPGLLVNKIPRAKTTTEGEGNIYNLRRKSFPKGEKKLEKKKKGGIRGKGAPLSPPRKWKEKPILLPNKKKT